MTLIWIGFLVALGAELISLVIDFYFTNLKSYLPKIKEGTLRKIFHGFALLGIFISFYGGIDTYRSLIAVKDYSLDARLNHCGLTGEAAPPLTQTTLLSQSLSTFLTCDSNKWSVNSCDASTTREIQKIIGAFPNNPWPAFYMAICLQYNGDSNWTNYANRAIKILQLTTTLEDHNKEQDIMFETLQDELKKPFSKTPSIMQQYINNAQKYNSSSALDSP